MGMEEQLKSDPRTTLHLLPDCVLMTVRARVALAALLAGQGQSVREGLCDLKVERASKNEVPIPRAGSIVDKP